METENFGIILNEAKEVKQEGCGMVRMERVLSEMEHGVDAEGRRKMGRRNSVAD
jgi:hypothetical protein